MKSRPESNLAVLEAWDLGRERVVVDSLIPCALLRCNRPLGGNFS